MFSLARAPSSVKKLPTFFTMMGGPAVGLRGLQTVIKSVLRAACVASVLWSLRSALTDAGVFRSFNWSRVVVYYQADPDDQKLADEFSNYALSNKLQIDFQRRQDSSQPDEDQRLLLTAEANVFVFFGGYGIALPLLLALWDVSLLRGCAGCFNPTARLLAAKRLQSAILCCCQSEMLSETSIDSLPSGVMNFHEAQFELMAPQKPLRERIERSVLIDCIRVIGYGLQRALQSGVNPADMLSLARTIRKAQIASAGLAVRGKNVTVQFDKGGNSLTPMSLTNLINGTWVSVGIYDPTVDVFQLDHQPVWPSTGRDVPRDIMSCGNGHIIVPMKEKVPLCRMCGEGTYSNQGTLTACLECAPGNRRLCIRIFKPV